MDYEVHVPSFVGAEMGVPVDWETDEPNGEGCGTQYIGDLDVEMYSTP